VCLEHRNTVAAQPAPPNSLHAYCGQRALATRPGFFFRPGGVSAVFGRIVDGHGVGDSRGVERRSKAGAVGVPGVDLRCRFSAGVKESGFEERVEDRVREWRAVLVRE